VSAPGFQPHKKIGVVIDVNSALQIDATLQIGQSTQTVEVNDSVVTIQMSDTESAKPSAASMWRKCAQWA